MQFNKKGQEVKYIKTEDLKKIREYLKYKNKITFLAFVNVGVNVGLRISDLSTLRFENIDRRSWTYTLIEKKTKKKRLIKLRLDEPFTINGVSKEFKKIEEYLNIPYPLGSHSLRKTWGKNVYDATLNIALIMKAFNHSSPGITLKYIGIEEEDINRLYEGIEI